MITPSVMPNATPREKPLMVLVRVNSACCMIGPRFSTNAAKIAVGDGSTNGLMPKATTTVCQVSSKLPITIHGIAISRRRRLIDVISDNLQGSGGSFSLAANLRYFVADLVNDVDEMRVESGFDGARPRQVDLVGRNHPAGPRAHDENDIRQIGRLAKVVGHQDRGE